MEKGFIHDLAESLPTRQINAQVWYNKQAMAFYESLADGINISIANIERKPAPMPIITQNQELVVRNRKCL